MTLVVIVSLFAIFFILAFLSKRRFGTLGLALAAGALLANNLTTWTAQQLAYFDIPTGPLSDKIAANVLLTILPAFVLLVSGPAYTKRVHAAGGALVFAVAATLLVLPLLAGVLPNDQLAQTVLPLIASYSNGLVAGAIGLAVVDMWLTHTIPSKSSKKELKK